MHPLVPLMNASEQRTTTRVQDGQVEESLTISKDSVFHLLQNSRRRAILRHLIEQDEDVFSMREVTELVAARENDTTVSELASDARQRVYIALYQSHLPKLDDTGVIDYDQDRGTFTPTPLVSVFTPYLDDAHATGIVFAAETA